MSTHPRGANEFIFDESFGEKILQLQDDDDTSCLRLSLEIPINYPESFVEVELDRNATQRLADALQGYLSAHPEVI